MGPKICLVLLSVLAVSWGYRFDCSTGLPEGKTLEDTETEPIKPFKIYTGGKNFLPGEYITVTIEGKSGARLTNFLLQGRLVDSQTTVGFFPRTARSPYQVQSCANHADTATNVDLEELNAFPATSFLWKAPTQGGVGQVEFVATVVDEQGAIWADIHSYILNLDAGVRGSDPDPLEMPEDPTDPHDAAAEDIQEIIEDIEMQGSPLSPNEGEATTQYPAEIPNEGEILEEQWRQEALRRDMEGEAREQALNENEALDPSQQAIEDLNEEVHNAMSEAARAAKWEELQAKLIEDEDTYGEGDWQLEELEREKAQEEERHWEEMDYERRQSQEEQRRQEMIRWEMRDKEEYDSQQMHSSTTVSPPTTTTTAPLADTETVKAREEDKADKENEVIKEWEEEIVVDEEFVGEDSAKGPLGGVGHLVSSFALTLFGVAIYFL